jgi:CRP/FNR family cyclic AMP-dependent transcriptional regulator
MVSLVTLTYSQPTRTLEPGDVLISEGDSGGTLYVLEAGQLVVERRGVAIATISQPDSMVGEMSVLLGTAHTATVRAARRSTVRVVRDALVFLERSPQLALRVATLVAGRLDATSGLLAELSRDDEGTPAEQTLLQRIMASLHWGQAAQKA